MNPTPQPCPLCKSPQSAAPFHRDAHRDYYRCSLCQLIFVPPSQHLSIEDERAEYDKHQNSPDDAGYRKFLSRLFTPLNDRLSPASYGLDFGSGPGPTLSVMFEEVGHKVSLYDPFYAPDKSVLNRSYDFITTTEVVEHLREPATDLEHLWSRIKPGGWLGIMTKLAQNKDVFSRWHYKNDLTHIEFFSNETMRWLATEWDAEVEIIGKDVILFRKRL